MTAKKDKAAARDKENFTFHYTDLFEMLLRTMMRDNPILLSLLYVCFPIAARRWINGEQIIQKGDLPPCPATT
jgi:hypothetical protein